jgi:hypothetical protein
METMVAQRAVDALLKSADTFAALSCAVGQSFDDTAMFKQRPDDSAYGWSVKRHPASERGRYKEHFDNIRRVLDPGDKRNAPGTTNKLSVSMTFDKGTQRPSGYMPVFRYTHRQKLGEEIVYLFHTEGAAALFIASCPAHETAVIRSMLTLAGELPLSKVCSWCGKVEGRMRKCPCGLSRYCGGACQTAHWPCHKEACTHPR